jgi:RNA 3'-terminal phosphate cyclase (ATP)
MAAPDESIVLDGSEGEGGGQILRAALCLSLITGKPFRILDIRANRKPSGLRPQHLACVRGAEAIGQGQAQGAQVGSSRLCFQPGTVKGGNYLLEVGTAGSTPLLLQCLFFPLALAGGGELRLQGGTHLAHSPSYHYLNRVWLPVMRLFGLDGQINLRYAGFYPEGAGELRAMVAPSGPVLGEVDLSSRGTLVDMDVTSMVANLPFEIAERQAKAAEASLRERGILCSVEKLPLPTMRSTGSVVFIRAEFERSIAGFTALGERGKRAEEVGREASTQVSSFMESAGAIDMHMGDQILMPAALLAAGKLPATPALTRYTPEMVTAHLTTHAAVIERFLQVKVEVGPDGAVVVSPRSGG